MSTGEREQWATRTGFILAAVGSAVGLGNIWRFPFQTGQEGGAVFLLIYLAFILVIGIPAVLVEFVLGRRSERNPIDTFERLGYDNWTAIGAFAVVGGFVIMSFYAVVAGWIVRYTAVSATGAYFDNPERYFLGVSAGHEAMLFQLLFLAVTVGVVALGIQRGIELAVKALVPALVVLMIGLIVYAATLDGAGAGYEWYLSPEFSVLADNWRSILPAAMGQAFFTLSLGVGVMITYASYIGENRNLGVDTGWIVGVDTAIAAMAGLIIFPVLFHVGVTPGDGGAGELFVGVGAAIAGVPGSRLVGVLFFGTILLAAVSSAISLVEVTVSYLVDHFTLDRVQAALGVGAVLFIVGLPAAYDTAVLELYDEVTAELLLPLTVFLLVLFVGWFYEEAVDELSQGLQSDLLPKAWLWHVRTVLLAVIGLTLALSVTELAADLPDILEDISLI